MDKPGNLTLYRKKKGLTIDELAKKVGVAGATICRYENGNRSMSVETAKKIASVLNVSWWRLYD